MFPSKGIAAQAVLDGLGHGVLIFDSANRLIAENAAARTLLGSDLKLIRAEGWSAAAALFNTRLGRADRNADAVRADALAAPRPVRFHIYRAGEYIPCWAAAIMGESGDVLTMITIEIPDWAALSDLMGRVLDETRQAVQATQGHADLIDQTMKRAKPLDTIEIMARRVGGFTRIIQTHMHRVGLLMDFLERLQAIRTGMLRERVRERRKRVYLPEFFEDFMEELDAIQLVDPETEAQDYRSRIRTDIPDGLALAASPLHLTNVLRDLLRNAIMYSLKATPVLVRAHAEEGSIQIDVIDEGYGVRASEAEKVFLPFQRARQPQIIGEFGYGLSLFLCKHEVEAMNGRIWFVSDEGVGSTFSFKLPSWQEDAPIKPSQVATMEIATKPDLSSTVEALAKPDQTEPSLPAVSTHEVAPVRVEDVPTRPDEAQPAERDAGEKSTPATV